MKRYLKPLLVITACTSSLAQADDSGWFVRPNLGVSSLSDVTATVDGVNGSSGGVDVSTDSGFVAGLGFGYQYNANLSAELAWEYRTNDSSVNFSDGQSIAKGNYASNTFFVNGIYDFDALSAIKPYMGAGLVWIQEVDIDIERPAGELSYAAGGDVGFQVFGGLAYELSDQVSLQAELRYTDISGIDLEPDEGSSGRFSGFEYQPTTLQLGVKYRF